MKYILLVMMAFVGIALGQGTYYPPVSLTGQNSSGQAVYIASDSNGNMLFGGASSSPAAIAPGYIPPIAMTAQGPNGNQVYLKADVNGNLLVSSSGGGGSVTWPTSGYVVISNGTSSPGGVAPVNGNCLVGSGGVWTTGACGSGGGGTTTNAITFNTSNSGASSGTTFNGASAVTISLNSIATNSTVAAYLATTTINPLAVNGTIKCDQYSGSLVAKLNACITDAAASSNGSVNGIADATGLGGTQSWAGTVTVLTGATLLLPSKCTWNVASATSGLYALVQQNNSNIWGMGNVTTGCDLHNVSGVGFISGLYSSLGATYVHMAGINFINDTYAINGSGGPVMLLSGSADGSLWERFRVAQYEGGGNGIFIGGTTSGATVCCTAKLRDFQVDMEYSGAIPIDVEVSGSTNIQGLVIENASLVKAGSGSPTLKLSDTTSGHQSSITFSGYEETQHGTNSQVLNQIIGFGSVTVPWITINDTSGSGTDAGFSVTNAYNTALVLGGINFTNYTLPANEVVNNFTGVTTKTNFSNSTSQGGLYASNSYIGDAQSNYVMATGAAPTGAFVGISIGTTSGKAWLRFGGNASAITSDWEVFDEAGVLKFDTSTTQTLIMDQSGNVTGLSGASLSGFGTVNIPIVQATTSVTTPAITLTGFTGTTCLEQVSGVVTSTGSACGSGGSGITGATSGQVLIAGSATTATSSKVLAGSGTGIVTGPTSATVIGDIATFSTTTGQIQDGAVLLSALAPKASPTFTGTVTVANLVNSALTAGFFPLAGSPMSNSSCDDGITTAVTVTCSHPITAPSYATNGTASGNIGLTAGSSVATAGTSTVLLTVPTSVTAYAVEFPGAQPTGGNTFLSCTAANPSICSWAAASGGGLPTGTIGQTVYYAAGGTTGTATNVVTVIGSGPSTSPTLSGGCNTGVTTCTLSSTTGVPTTGGYILFTNLGSSQFLWVSYTGVSGSTITGLTRGVWGSTDLNLSSGDTAEFVSEAELTSTSALPNHVLFSNGATLNNWATSDYNNTGITPNVVYFGTLGIFSGLYGIKNTNQSIQGETNGLVIQNGGGTNNWVVDTNGATGTTSGTIAVVSGTTSITPASGTVVLTGAPPTAWLTMVATTIACTTNNVSCEIKLINTTSGSITTSSGSSAGNFASAFVLAAKARMDCSYYGSPALWYCN